MRLCLPVLALLLASTTFWVAEAALAGVGDPPQGYTPEPDIEELIERARQKDKAAAKKAMERLLALGAPAERALRWHLAKEPTLSGRIKWAELLAYSVPGRVGYRIILELQPDGSGSLTLWRDNAVLADCGKRYRRLLGEREPVYPEEVLRHNCYSKIDLLRHLPEGMKYLEGRVEPKEGRIEVAGSLSFKHFDALAEFAKSFDPYGYQLIGGCALSDTRNNTRLFRYRKARDDDRQRFQENLLQFYDVKWEFVLDFKGQLAQHNAASTDRGRLAWQFNCHQMVSGEALVEASYDNAGLGSRPAPLDEPTLNIPAVVPAGQPVAIVKYKEIRVKPYLKLAGVKPSAKDLREKGQLVELDGRDSLPQDAGLQYQWVQTYGNDLKLSPERLSTDWLCLYITAPGEYRFELTVSANEQYSKPVEVKVFVEPEAKLTENHVPPTPVEPPPKIEKPIEQPKVVEPKTPAPKTPEPKTTEHTPPQQTPAVEPTPTPPPVARDPEKAKGLYATGLAAFKAFELNPAKENLQQAAAFDPDNGEYRYALAQVLMDAGDFDAAAELFKEHAALTKQARAFMSVGHCYARMNKFEDARNWYRRGVQLDESLMWECVWQLGHTRVRAKDYKTALGYLLEAEEKANGMSKDYRLLRDVIVALHASQRDVEALQRLNALEASGYQIDAQTAADIKAAAAAAPKKVEPPPQAAGNEAPKVAAATNDTAKVAPTPTLEVPKPHPAQNPTPATPVAPAAPATPATATIPANPTTPPTPATPTTPTPATPVKEEKKPKPKRIRKPLPALPENFDDALSAGQRALQTGQALWAQSSDEAREKALQAFDEAEAMLRGAWAFRPDNQSVRDSLEQLAQHIGPIALVRSAAVKSKPNGLIVLDGEPSVAVDGKPFYCVWEQVDGDELPNLRPENMAQKKLGLRIKKPGIYKFELAVSDGSRSGMPAAVTVEVAE